MPPPLERSLLASVLRRLRQIRACDPRLVYRKRHGGPFATAGDPDIHGVWAGVPFEIELKQIGEKPTPLQAARLLQWGRAGAVCSVVHNLQELEQFLATVQPLP